MKRFLAIIAAGLLVLTLGACGRKPESQPPAVAAVGKPAPDFTLADLDGRTWRLSELKGKVVFINFWATWCPPCREEMPSMQRLHTMLPEDGFIMLAILNQDRPALGKAFAAKAGLTMPILVDQANTVGPRYGITGVPETYIVDKNGILREKVIGGARWDSPAAVRLIMKYIKAP